MVITQERETIACLIHYYYYKLWKWIFTSAMMNTWRWVSPKVFYPVWHKLARNLRSLPSIDKMKNSPACRCWMFPRWALCSFGGYCTVVVVAAAVVGEATTCLLFARPYILARWSICLSTTGNPVYWWSDALPSICPFCPFSYWLNERHFARFDAGLLRLIAFVPFDDVFSSKQ